MLLQLNKTSFQFVSMMSHGLVTFVHPISWHSDFIVRLSMFCDRATVRTEILFSVLLCYKMTFLRTLKSHSSALIECNELFAALLLQKTTFPYTYIWKVFSLKKRKLCSRQLLLFTINVDAMMPLRWANSKMIKFKNCVNSFAWILKV